jgi:hypothetical protein
MKLATFWDLTPCNPYMNKRFGGTYQPYCYIFASEDGGDNFFEMPLLYRSRRYISGDRKLHTYGYANFKSYL